MPIPQSAKQIAINAAKQAARESNEFLKEAGKEVLGTPEAPKHEERPQEPAKETPQEPPKKDLSFLNNYKGELEQIHRDNLFKELQQKIAEGIEIPLEDYIKELSVEQREVLKAQMEAVKMQKAAAKNQKMQESPLQVIAKKGRQMVNKIKKQNEQHVETRQAPSG